MSIDRNSGLPRDLSYSGPNVFAVFGAEPEVQAYAMAKYSRSALSMRESLNEISQQKAEKFLNTYYFQYGHRSIADLAHVVMAVERLSLLAAIHVVDEQRWDGQERSTRYQDFKKCGYYVPQSIVGQDAALLRESIELLFEEYQVVSAKMFDHLKHQTPRPEDMKQDAYERTLRARAFDFARYLLPLATITSLGQIVNARTLESQVARLLSSPYDEVRRIGEQLKAASQQPAYDPSGEAAESLLRRISELDERLAQSAAELLARKVAVAPTLVKYANEREYEIKTRSELRQAAKELLQGAAIEPAPIIDLLDDDPLEVEIATTLLFEHCHYRYRQVRDRVQELSGVQRQEIITLGTKYRDPHDELLRAFRGGYNLRFDALIDIGAYRDLHRHRRCVQIAQDFTMAHGYETPSELQSADALEGYAETMRRTSEVYAKLAAVETTAAAYLIPLAFRKRALFKMDFAEAVYITELRTSPAGHFSYRNAAYKMYEAVARKFPALAGCFRVYDVSGPIDLLKR